MKRFQTDTLRAFRDDTSGATLTELAIVIPTLLLLVLGAVEFGRFGYNEVLAHKATDLAVRTAAVRPAICANVPETFQPVSATGGTPPRYGTLCRVGNVCEPQPERSCTLATPGTGTASANAADEVWATIAPLLPNGTTRANVRIRYTYDELGRLGFLGGPYTPIVTAELEGLQFQFVTPLGALATLATAGSPSNIPNAIPFPNMSASLPGEDLGHGAGS